jgi:hypothetical protein
MEVPIDQARLIHQIILDFAVRLATLEIAVQKTVSSETFEEARKAAGHFFATPDISVKSHPVEYASLLEPLQAIYTALQRTPS